MTCKKFRGIAKSCAAEARKSSSAGGAAKFVSLWFLAEPCA
jgi:hypothetical protein